MTGLFGTLYPRVKGSIEFAGDLLEVLIKFLASAKQRLLLTLFGIGAVLIIKLLDLLQNTGVFYRVFGRSSRLNLQLLSLSFVREL